MTIRGAPVLHHFQSLLPQFQIDQLDAIHWLALAHTFDGHDPSQSQGGLDEDDACQRMRKLISRFGCDPSKVKTRYSALGDFTHSDWEKMRIYNLRGHPAGAGSAERSRLFAEIVEGVFSRIYAETERAPQALIHVTCTGYVSPSGAQRLVSKKAWGKKTEVLHAYHMGCYASLPAIRIADGLLARHGQPGALVDIVHTELCTLHLNPGLHSPEQLVIQSLFGDGLIKYGVSRDFPQGLEVLTLREEIVPDSESAMSWEVGDFGMVMSLARDVPDRLAKCLPDFFESLCDEIGIHSQQARSSALFAIHPGGPKIIDRIQDILGLSEEQVNASREILRANGNMSSATLPHIWKRILENPRVPSGQLVFTFGFGPGLTLSSGVLRKIG